MTLHPVEPMKPHKRPVQDFRITCVESELDIEARHRAAGFEPVPREVMIRRFFTFVDFLQQKRMTTRTITAALDDVDDGSELRNADLTDEGFEFVRQYHGKWLNRMYKDAGDAKELAVLEKWYQKLRDAR